MHVLNLISSDVLIKFLLLSVIPFFFTILCLTLSIIFSVPQFLIGTIFVCIPAAFFKWFNHFYARQLDFRL